MNIQALNSLTSQTFMQRDTENKNKLGQQEFLHLLVTQMRNQDPMSPLDGADFAAQLAQFNTVEQLIGVNQELKILKQSQDLMSMSMINSMATSLTGKSVKALSNQVHLYPDAPPTINYKLNNSAEKVEIIIRNSSGAEVRREVIEGVPSGDNTWNWDGLNDSGVQLMEGEYTIEINASNEDSSVNALVYTIGVVDKVRFEEDGVYIIVNNIAIPIGDVEEVSNPVSGKPSFQGATSIQQS